MSGKKKTPEVARDAAKAYEQSGLYTDFVAKLGEWFTVPPELKTYEGCPSNPRVVGRQREPKNLKLDLSVTNP